MDASLAAFKDSAPYLMHPLVRVGFALLLFFGLYRTFLKAGIVPPLTAHGKHAAESAISFCIAVALGASRYGK